MKKVFRYCCSALLILSMFALPATAQELVVTGTIISDDTGEPLPGAEIQVKGTLVGTTANMQGKFELKIANATEADLVVNYVGYRSTETRVLSSTSNLVIRLAEDIIKGSEVVVTGFASSVKRQNLANSVATLSAEELLPAPTQSMESALSGKFAGISVSQNTGAPGGGFSVQLRGTSTIEGRTQPLYVVDGVIIDNSATQSGIDIVTAATGAGSRTPQGQPVNRIADINPADIANVEVLKGASAAAIYGSKASNGVVIISTKKGTIGKTNVDVQQQIGFSSILNKLGTRQFNSAAEAEAQYGDNGRIYFERNNGRFIDQEDVLYGETGLASLTSISVRGGSAQTQFFVSGSAQDESGIIQETGYERLSGRLNINHQFSERTKLDLSSTVLRTESNRGMTGNDNTNRTFGFALASTPSFIDLEAKDFNTNAASGFAVNPFSSSNPVETRALLTNNERVYRTLNSARFTYNLLRNSNQNLDFIVLAGFDFYSQFNQVVTPSSLVFEQGADEPGTSLDGETRNLNSNFYYNLAHLYTTDSRVVFKTSTGVQFENRNLNNTLVEAHGLPVTETNVDQGASVQVYQNQVQQYDQGFYFQEEIDLKGKVYVTGSVRADRSSAHGDVDKFYYYPKFSSSIRLSEYGFWDGLSSLSEEFKLRFAYGETGNSPPPDAKYTELIAANSSGNAGLVTSIRKGNPDIEPERTRELEVGFDAVLLKGRGSLEVSYYTQKITDLILTPDLAPSSGFTEEIVNAGEMSTRGVEIGVGLSVIRKQNFRWNTRFNFFKTSSTIDQLDVDPFNLGGFATFLGTYRIEEGVSPTTIVGSESDSEGNFVELGNETPDFELGFNNTFNIGNFGLTFLWHMKQGGEVINLGKLITDLGGTSPDWDTGAPEERLAVLGTETAPYIEDGSYIKLREVNLTYQLSSSAVKSLFGNQVSYLRFGVSGRNLLAISDYTGYDPEVSQFGSVAIGRSVDTIPFPSARSFYFNISFGL